MLSLGPTRPEAKPICRWRNIWNRVEAIRCDMRMPPSGPGSGRAQADSLSARAGGRWKIVARGAAEIIDGSPSHLRAQGRRRTQSSVREPPEFVRSGIAGADD